MIQETHKPLLLGIEKFNIDEYFLVHKYFELVGIVYNSPGRDLYRALIQIIVVCYRIERVD